MPLAATALPAAPPHPCPAERRSLASPLQEWDKIWTINKKIIDPVCPRHTAIEDAARVPVTATNVQAQDSVEVPRHKKHPPAGRRCRCVDPELRAPATSPALHAALEPGRC
jgi:hypothetical protein